MAISRRGNNLGLRKMNVFWWMNGSAGHLCRDQENLRFSDFQVFPFAKAEKTAVFELL